MSVQVLGPALSWNGFSARTAYSTVFMIFFSNVQSVRAAVLLTMYFGACAEVGVGRPYRACIHYYCCCCLLCFCWSLSLFLPLALSETVAAPVMTLFVSRVTEVMKGIAAKWRELSDPDKAEWMTKAAADKDR